MYYLIPYIKSSCYGLQSSIKTGLTSSLSRLLSWTHSPLLIYISPHSIIILYRSSIYFLHSIYFIFCSSPPSLHPAHPNCIFLHIRDFVSIEFLAHNMYTGIFAEWLNDTPGSIIIQLQIQTLTKIPKVINQKIVLLIIPLPKNTKLKKKLQLTKISNMVLRLSQQQKQNIKFMKMELKKKSILHLLQNMIKQRLMLQLMN